MTRYRYVNGERIAFIAAEEAARDAEEAAWAAGQADRDLEGAGALNAEEVKPPT